MPQLLTTKKESVGLVVVIKDKKILARIFYGSLLLFFATYIILWTTEIAFETMLVASGIIIFREWINLTKIKNIWAILMLTPLPAIIGIIPANFLNQFFNENRTLSENIDLILMGVILTLYLYAILDILRHEKKLKPIASNKIISLVFGIIIISSFIFFSIKIYRVSPQFALACLLMVAACDSGGYILGRFIQGRKLCPNTSPGKTYSGLLGSIIFCIVSYSLLALIFPALPFSVLTIIMLFPFPLMVNFGDLYQSTLKRLVGTKDSGNIIPGHGGFFDRADGLLWSAPCFYLILLLCGYAS